MRAVENTISETRYSASCHGDPSVYGQGFTKPSRTSTCHREVTKRSRTLACHSEQTTIGHSHSLEFTQNSKLTLKLRSALLSLLLLFFTLNSYAQTFPVQAFTQLTPPYSPYLADYAIPGSEQLRVNLLLRDLNEPSLDVQLHLTIEGASVRIETNPAFNPPPITLEGGINKLLDGDELAPYLDSRNLLFSGITRQQYEQSAALPEGFYRFTFRVIGFNRPDVVLSPDASSTAWLVLNDPPRINTPQCGTELTLNDPQNILFQWLPMNTGSPNTAFSTEYTLEIFEIRPPGRDPNIIVQSTPPIFEATTSNTSFVYGITEPPLIPGMEYAFRIQARDNQGRDLFKNNGYSQVCTFTFGEVNLLTPPDGINVYPEAERRAKVTWYLGIDPDSYRVEYRKIPSDNRDPDAGWFTIETTDDYTVINDLEPETSYQVRVASLFNGFTSRYSDIKDFITPAARIIACGDDIQPVIDGNTKPLITANVGDIFKVGEFEMRIIRIRGGDGTFTGYGAVIIPYLGLKVYSKFESIKVNENQQVIDGEVVALTEGAEGLIKRWEEENDDIDGGTEGEEGDEEDGTDEQSDNGGDFQGDEIDFNGDIKDVVVDENGDIVIKKEDGTEEIIPGGKPTRITDSNGDVWTVDENGKVTKSSVGSGEQNSNAGPPSSDLDEFGLLVKNSLLALRGQFDEEIKVLQADFQDKRSQVNASLTGSASSAKRQGTAANISIRTELLISTPQDAQASQYKESNELEAHLKLIEELKAINGQISASGKQWTATNDLLEDANFFSLVDELKSADQEVTEDNIQEILEEKINTGL